MNFTDQTAQTITVRAKDDLVEEPPHTSTITHAITATGDPDNYPTSLTIPDVTVNITDNDLVEVVLFEDSFEVSEWNGSGSKTARMTGSARHNVLPTGAILRRLTAAPPTPL